MTIKQAIQKGMIELKGNKIESPKIKARLLMQYILNQSRQFIIVHDLENLTIKQEQGYFEMIQKLKENIPIEHITHQKEFMKLKFFVGKEVLIPRQDTEVLVEEALKIAQKISAKKILDLCTGSGAIAVSMAKYRKQSEITAIDISRDALKVAIKNAKENAVEGQITFLESNLFENLPEEKYDMILSNPPYIPKEEIQNLDKQVQQEPLIALDGGWDGLDFYRKIIKDGYRYLKYRGYLCLEIGYDQKEQVIDLLDKEKQYGKPHCVKDLYGNDRVVIAQII